jgi:hypothetical protein
MTQEPYISPHPDCGLPHDGVGRCSRCDALRDSMSPTGLDVSATVQHALMALEAEQYGEAYTALKSLERELTAYPREETP